MTLDFLVRVALGLPVSLLSAPGLVVVQQIAE
jgi:hypothetical protein